MSDHENTFNPAYTQNDIDFNLFPRSIKDRINKEFVKSIVNLIFKQYNVEDLIKCHHCNEITISCEKKSETEYSICTICGNILYYHSNGKTLPISYVKDVFDKYCRSCYHLQKNHFENEIRAVIQCSECNHDEEIGGYCERRQF